MMTEHLNQPSNLSGIVAHTSKLSKSSVTTLVKKMGVFVQRKETEDSN
jgi:hypothetical protein